MCALHLMIFSVTALIKIIVNSGVVPPARTPQIEQLSARQLKLIDDRVSRSVASPHLSTFAGSRPRFVGPHPRSCNCHRACRAFNLQFHLFIYAPSPLDSIFLSSPLLTACRKLANAFVRGIRSCWGLKNALHASGKAGGIRVIE